MSGCFRAVLNHLVLLPLNAASPAQICFRAVPDHLVLLLPLTHRRASSVYVLHFFVFLIWRFHAEAVSLPLGSTEASLHKLRPLLLRITCSLIVRQEALLNGSAVAPQDIATWLDVVLLK